MKDLKKVFNKHVRKVERFRRLIDENVNKSFGYVDKSFYHLDQSFGYCDKILSQFKPSLSSLKSKVKLKKPFLTIVK